VLRVGTNGERNTVAVVKVLSSADSSVVSSDTSTPQIQEVWKAWMSDVVEDEDAAGRKLGEYGLKISLCADPGVIAIDNYEIELEIRRPTEESG
jgi:hypothetical protein